MHNAKYAREESAMVNATAAQKKYDIVSPSSMGVRLTPVGNCQVHETEMFYLQATSAETNVLTISSSLGRRTKVLTAFVQGSPIARFIKNDLHRRNIEIEGPELPQGGPWGLRHQFNIADSGSGLRGPRVANDRAGEIGQLLESSFYDLDKLFRIDGVEILHMSGLVAALSPGTGKLCLELARLAAKTNTRISFDINYRASFWADRKAELRSIFTELASLSDILIGNEEDFQLALGLEGPEAGGRNLGANLEGFKKMISSAEKAFPRASVFTTTLRQVLSADQHLWGAILYEKGNWHYIEPRSIPVTDRIGGGDGYVGGLLYGIGSGWSAEKAMQFAWATGALAVGGLKDFLTPMDEDQVWNAWSGNARVIR